MKNVCKSVKNLTSNRKMGEKNTKRNAQERNKNVSSKFKKCKLEQQNAPFPIKLAKTKRN